MRQFSLKNTVLIAGHFLCETVHVLCKLYPMLTNGSHEVLTICCSVLSRHFRNEFNSDSIHLSESWFYWQYQTQLLVPDTTALGVRLLLYSNNIQIATHSEGHLQDILFCVGICVQVGLSIYNNAQIIKTKHGINTKKTDTC